MDSVKPKRFSFAGFGSGLSRSLSFSSSNKIKKDDEITPPDNNEDKEKEEGLRKLKRAQKSKSLYIKSFVRKSSAPDAPALSQYDASEATQSNSKEIRASIRRSLSAVLYASPHSTDEDKSSYSNKLVPVLVTPGLSESVGGILVDDGTKNKIKKIKDQKEEELKKKKKKPVEYDNSLEILPSENTTTIIWQGYGYAIQKAEQEEVASEMKEEGLQERFENEIWSSYCGLIHPLHLFNEAELDTETIVQRGRWAGLSVTELRRYYDNYGSMMLKIRETRMIEQQKHYQALSDVKSDWIIPNLDLSSQTATVV